MARTTKRATSSSEDSPAVETVEQVADAVTPQPEAVMDPMPDFHGKEDPAEPSATPAAPAQVVQQRRGLPVVLGGILAAGLGFGLAQFVPDGWPIADTSALDASVQTQAQEIAALKQAIADLSAADLSANEPAPVVDLSPVTKAVAALSDRVTALESSPAESPDLSDLRAAIAKLETDLAALQTAGPGTAAATALAAEAEARLQEAEAQAAQMRAEAEALTKTAIARAALGRLQAALDSGAPFADILPELGVEAPAALTEYAEAGLPSLDSLKASFPDVARAALDASLRADMGETWSERATSFLFAQTGARSLTPREGNDPDAILSRAEAALAVGDLELTLTELAALPAVAQSALTDWRALAEQRQAGVKAMAYVTSKIEG